MSDFLPIFFKVSGRPCLVVGGGELATRKVRQLARVHAEVHVMAPVLCHELAEMQAVGDIYHHPQIFEDDVSCA